MDCSSFIPYPSSDMGWKVLNFCFLFACLQLFTSILPCVCTLSHLCSTEKLRVLPVLFHEKEGKKKSQPFWATLSAQGSTSFLDPKECKADTKPICLLRNHFLMRHVCAKPKAKTPETTLKGNCLALSPSPSSMSWHSLKHDPTRSNQRATSGRGSCFL